MIAVVVVAAGAIAAVIRYLVSLAFARRRPRSSTIGNVPLAVLTVNVVGSAIGGVVLGLATTGGVSSDLRLILLTGFCGGLTTFSTWSVETIQLVIDGKWRSAVVSVGLNLVLGVGAAAAAYSVVLAQA